MSRSSSRTISATMNVIGDLKDKIKIQSGDLGIMLPCKAQIMKIFERMGHLVTDQDILKLS